MSYDLPQPVMEADLPMRTLIIAAILSFGLLAVPAQAKELSPEHAALVPKAEAALQAIGVMTADFVFNNKAGAHTGRLFVDRVGGRLRMEFDPPLSHLLIANGPRVDFIGGDGTVLNTGTQSTPLALVFGRNAELSDDVEVLEVGRKKGVVSVVVAQRERRDDGTVILHFQEAGDVLALKGWGFVDSDRRYTRTTLKNMRHGAEIPDAFFIAPREGR